VNTASPFAHADAPVPIPAPVASLSLWWCSLAPAATTHAVLAGWLSDAEKARTYSFGTEALRYRYVAGRGTLRWLLAGMLDVAPADVKIMRGVRGRPQLAGHSAVDFNVTHTGERALIGIGTGMRLGVDVERRDRVINTAGVARKFMTPSERAALPQDPDAARRDLLRLWTCKEAMSKATGDALSAPFARIDVALSPELRVADGPAPYAAPDWTLHSLKADADYLATVALWHARDPEASPRG
jgi:4'-phosphopantetheinyl transferase